MKKFIVLAIIVFAMLLACGDDPPKEDPKKLGTISIGLPADVTPDNVPIGTLLIAMYEGGTVSRDQITYQWNKDGTGIPNETSVTFTPQGNGEYTVTASAIGKSVTSAAVTVKQLGAISISLPEGIASNNVPLGTQLTAVYNGEETVSYQWNKGTAAIANQTAETFTPAETGEYTVTVSAANFQSITSAAVTVRQLGTIRIGLPAGVNDPNNVPVGTVLTAVYEGGTVSTELITFQWYRDTTAIPNETLITFTPGENGVYTVTAGAANYQSITGSAVTVVGAALPFLSGPVNIQPATDVFAGTQLTAVYAGTETGVSFQWNKDEASIAGATNSTFIPTDAGSYTVTARAVGYQSITSAAVTVVLPALTILPNYRYNALAGTELSAEYEGPQTGVTFQWNKDGTPIAGATNLTFIPTDAGSYTITASIAGLQSITGDAVTVVSRITFADNLDNPGREFSIDSELGFQVELFAEYFEQFYEQRFEDWYAQFLEDFPDQPEEAIRQAAEQYARDEVEGLNSIGLIPGLVVSGKAKETNDTWISNPITGIAQDLNSLNFDDIKGDIEFDLNGILVEVIVGILLTYDTEDDEITAISVEFTTGDLAPVADMLMGGMYIRKE